jgi:hypothetical protein
LGFPSGKSRSRFLKTVAQQFLLLGKIKGTWEEVWDCSHGAYNLEIIGHSHFSSTLLKVQVKDSDGGEG